MQKKIIYILNGRDKHVTPEETVLQPLPQKEFRFANPFILLHHQTPKNISAGEQLRIHPHPHRGFAPVTFMLQGEGNHKDNAGNDVTVKAGDVQWMFAGKGILHSEEPSANLMKHGGMYEFIQLWINVPQQYKLSEPFYRSVTSSDMPKIVFDNGVVFQLASGRYDNLIGPLESFTPITMMIGVAQECTQIELNAQEYFWTLLYVVKGSILINCETINEHQLIVFEKENDELLFSMTKGTQILFFPPNRLMNLLRSKTTL